MKKSQNIIVLACLVMGLVGLYGCKSAKSAVGGYTAIQITKEDITYLRSISDNYQYSKNLTAKLKFNAGKDGEGFSLSGNLKMRRDDVIQISLRALGIMEVARIEFTPDYAMLIDRYHKCYVKEKYEAFDFLKTNGLNFYSMQALFWNELFCPGYNTIGESNLNIFKVNRSGESVYLSLRDEVKPKTALMKATSFTWQTNGNQSKITSSDVRYKDKNGVVSKFSWYYGEFKKIRQRLFPTEQTLSISTANTNIAATLTLSDLDTDENWETRTTLSGKYAQVTLEELLNNLKNL